MKYNWKNIKKIGLGVMAFEGSEHLKNILSELRDIIDYIILAYLDTSYHGDKIDPSDKATILSLKEIGLADDCINIQLDLTELPRKLECEKRNLILNILELQGCSHALIIDADEFYTHDTFISALLKIDDNNYECTYCQYVNYYHDYLHYLVYPFALGMYVPFISKINYRFTYDCQDFPYPSDPTRRYVMPKDKNGSAIKLYHIFDWTDIKMHHLSWIRVNIRKKMKSWSSKKCFENQELLIDQAVYDFETFNDDTKKVRLVFNTPGNSVKIATFPKQYIFPNYDYKECLIHANNDYNILWLTRAVDNSSSMLPCIKFNHVYYNVINGFYDMLDANMHEVYVKNIFESDLYLFIQAVRLILDEYNTYPLDYIIFAVSEEYTAEMDKLKNIIDNISDESLIFYYDKNLFGMSMRSFNILNEEAQRWNYKFQKDNIDYNNILDVIIHVFENRALKIGADKDLYLKCLQ